MTEFYPNTRIDRLFAGGSLYPPPDYPARFSRLVSGIIIVLTALAAWALIALAVWLGM